MLEEIHSKIRGRITKKKSKTNTLKKLKQTFMDFLGKTPVAIFQKISQRNNLGKLSKNKWRNMCRNSWDSLRVFQDFGTQGFPWTNSREIPPSRKIAEFFLNHVEFVQTCAVTTNQSVIIVHY